MILIVENVTDIYRWTFGQQAILPVVAAYLDHDLRPIAVCKARAHI